MAKAKNKNKNKGGKQEEAAEVKAEEVQNEVKQEESTDNGLKVETQETATTLRDLNEVKTEKRTESGEQTTEQPPVVENTSQEEVQGDAQVEESQPVVEQIEQQPEKIVELVQEVPIEPHQMTETVVQAETIEVKVEEKHEEKFEVNQNDQNEPTIVQAAEKSSLLEEEDIQISVDTSADFQNLEESVGVESKPTQPISQFPIPPAHQQTQPEQKTQEIIIDQEVKVETIVEEVKVQTVKEQKIDSLDQTLTVSQNNNEIFETQVIQVEESEPILLIKSTELPQNQEQNEVNKNQNESLLISESVNSGFIKDEEVEAQALSKNHEQKPVEEVRVAEEVKVKVEQTEQASVEAEVKFEVKVEKNFVQSEPILIESFPIQPEEFAQKSPIEQIKKELREVESIILENTNHPEHNEFTIISSNTTETILLSQESSQPTTILTESDIEQLRAKNEEEEGKRKRLKEQEEHEKWTKMYEQRRKREEEERKRYEEEMRRIKEEEEKRKLKKEKENVEKEDSQVRKNLDELKKIKKEFENEKPLPAKLGISLAASLVVGSAAWFGLHNKNITALGALASLALAFVVQK